MPPILMNSSLLQSQHDLQQLLHDFEDIFQEPRLPPIREIDHHINPKKGIEPINVRPYRYAYFHNAEIENRSMTW